MQFLFLCHVQLNFFYCYSFTILFFKLLKKYNGEILHSYCNGSDHCRNVEKENITWKIKYMAWKKHWKCGKTIARILK